MQIASESKKKKEKKKALVYSCLSWSSSYAYSARNPEWILLDLQSSLFEVKLIVPIRFTVDCNYTKSVVYWYFASSFSLILLIFKPDLDLQSVRMHNRTKRKKNGLHTWSCQHLNISLAQMHCTTCTKCWNGQRTRSLNGSLTKDLGIRAAQQEFSNKY